MMLKAFTHRIGVQILYYNSLKANDADNLDHPHQRSFISDEENAKLQTNLKGGIALARMSPY